MKKIKRIMASIAKWAVFICPGIITVRLLASAHGWIVSLLAALGVVSLISIVFAIGLTMAAEVKARRDMSKSTHQDQ